MFLSFGNETRFHLQTYFAIVSLIRFMSDRLRIVVYTDKPNLYKRLSDRISVAELSQSTIDEWANGTGYVYRTKIMSIMNLGRRFPDDNLIFIDSDTVITKPLDNLVSKLEAGHGLMHRLEGHPSAMHKSQKRLWKALKGRAINGITISNRHYMWNSGVIGVPAGKVEAIANIALGICDAALEANARCMTTEQYAFSIAMAENLELYPAADNVLHYWGNKEQWLPVVSNFVQQSHLEALTVDEELDRVSLIDFDKFPIYVKRSNTRNRLVRLVERMFPDKTIY